MELNFKSEKVGYSNGNKYSIRCILSDGPHFEGGGNLFLRDKI